MVRRFGGLVLGSLAATRAASIFVEQISNLLRKSFMFKGR